MEFCYPEEVAEGEAAEEGWSAGFGELGEYVVAVVFGADFAVVEDEVDGECAGAEGDGVEGWEGCAWRVDRWDGGCVGGYGVLWGIGHGRRWFGWWVLAGLGG